MNEYLLKKKSLLDALASAGNDIFEDDHILYILSGLNADYDAFVISVTTRTESMKIQDVCVMLLAHESRIDFAPKTFKWGTVDNILHLPFCQSLIIILNPLPMSTGYNISSSTHINHNPTTFNHPLSTKLSSTNYKVIECFLIFRELTQCPLSFFQMLMM